MRVKVKFFAELRELLGEGDEFECSCGSPAELLEELMRRYPALAKKAKEYGDMGLVVLVNGRDLRHLERLPEGDISVSVFPPAAGG